MRDETESTSEEQEFASRRHVIRGLASVPVILTLGNGSAEANVSNHQCIADSNAVPDPGCADLSTSDQVIDDGFVRQTFSYDYTLTPSDPGYDPSNPITETRYKSCVVYGTEPTPGTLAQHSYIVDQDGGAVTAPSEGNPLTVSCLTSF